MKISHLHIYLSALGTKLSHLIFWYKLNDIHTSCCTEWIVLHAYPALVQVWWESTQPLFLSLYSEYKKCNLSYSLFTVPVVPKVQSSALSLYIHVIECKIFLIFYFSHVKKGDPCETNKISLTRFGWISLSFTHDSVIGGYFLRGESVSLGVRGNL